MNNIFGGIKIKKNIAIFVITNSLIIALTIFFFILINNNPKHSANSTLNDFTILKITTDEQEKTKSRNHFINNSEEYKPKITITNGFSETYLYRIYILLDYKQIEVEYEKKINPYIDVLVKANSTKEIHVKIPNMSKGTHDLVGVLVRDPDYSLKEENYINPLKYMLIKRVPVIVESEEIKRSDYREIKPFTKDLGSKTFFISEEPTVEFKKHLSLIQKSNNRDFWMNLPVSIPHTRFAVFAILNKKQILINQPFYQSNNIGTASIPLSLPDNVEGNLIVGIIENPYILLKSPDEYEKETAIGFYMNNKITILNN